MTYILDCLLEKLVAGAVLTQREYTFLPHICPPKFDRKGVTNNPPPSPHPFPPFQPQITIFQS